MKLATSVVPLTKIKPTASSWNFLASELEAAARSVLDLQGIVNPIVVRPEPGTDAYVILDGNFEYYALAYAYQSDPRGYASIEVFVVEPSDEATVQKQVLLLRQQFAGSPQWLHPDWRYGDRPSRPLPGSIELPHPTTLPAATRLLQVFNHAGRDQLLVRMQRIGLLGKNAEKVVEAIEQERRQKLFLGLRDVVVRVKGLSYEKMLDLVEIE